MPGAFAKVFSFGVYGIDAYQVTVEVDVTIGQQEQSIFQIVGLPEGAVKESRERVRAAISNASFWFPTGRVTANMAPADVNKEGATFDLLLAPEIGMYRVHANHESGAESVHFEWAARPSCATGDGGLNR